MPHITERSHLISSSERNQLSDREPRWLKCRYVFSVMSFLGFVNVYAMRVNLSVAIVAMVNNTAISTNATIDNNTCPDLIPPPTNKTQDSGDGPFDWNEQEQGLILGSFFYGYVLTQVPGGRMAEIWGGKWLFGVGVLITSIFTLLTPWAAYTGVGMFTFIRVLEGLGEGVTFPAMHAMLSKWAPPNERSGLSGWVYSGASLGTVLSMPTSGYMCDRYGWESVFYLSGLLGIIWFLFWSWIVFDSPSKHPRISAGEKEYIAKCIGPAAHSDKSPPVPWRHIFTSVPVWAIIITHIAQNWGFYTLLTELPTYMKNILHFNIKDNSAISALPYVFSLLISLFFSPVADYIIVNRIMGRSVTRKLFNSLGFCLPAVFLVLAGYSGCNVTSTIAFLALAGGTNAFHYSGLMSTHLDMAPNFAGTLLGITNGFANIMGFVAPAFTGYIINEKEDIEHWRFVFFVASIVYFSGNMFYIGFGSVKEQPWNNLELLEATRREQEAEERSRDIHNNSTQNDHHHTQHRRGVTSSVRTTLTYIQTRGYDPINGLSELEGD